MDPCYFHDRDKFILGLAQSYILIYLQGHPVHQVQHTTVNLVVAVHKPLSDSLKTAYSLGLNIFYICCILS